jgi:hypothetical protein
MQSPARAVKYVFTFQISFMIWCCVWYLTMQVRMSAPMQSARSISLSNAWPMPIPPKHWPSFCPSVFRIFRQSLKMELALLELLHRHLPCRQMQLSIGVCYHVVPLICLTDTLIRSCHFARHCLQVRHVRQISLCIDYKTSPTSDGRAVRIDCFD